MGWRSRSLAVAVVACTACGRYGFESRAGVGGDGGAGRDGGDGGAGDALAGDAIVNLCGTTPIFSDGFDTGSPGPTFALTMNTGVTVSEAASELQLAFAASTPKGNYSYYRTVTAYTAEGLCAVAEVAGTPDPTDANAIMYFKFHDQPSGKEMEFFISGGQLLLRAHTPSVTTLSTTTFDAVADRFLRLRQQSGLTHFELSPDGVAFTELANSLAFTPTTAQVELGAGAVNALTNGGTALFAGTSATGP